MIEIDPDEIEWSAIRAQGAGGQNVNKVSTALHLRYDVRASSLPGEVKDRLLQSPDQRISGDGIVIIKAQRYRSQERNREDAIARLREIVEEAAALTPERRATRPTRASQRRRVDSKVRSGQTKAGPPQAGGRMKPILRSVLRTATRPITSQAMYQQKPKRSAAIRAHVDALIQEEDRSAEISAGLVRIFAGMALGAVAIVTAVSFPHSEQVASSHYRGGALIVGGFILAGLVAVGLARSPFYRRELAYVFLALDAVLIGLFLHLTFQNTGFSGDLAGVFPVVWLPPLLLTVAVLRIQPNVQVFGLVAFAVVMLSVVLAHGSTDPESRYLIAGRTAPFFAPQANIMRLAMLLLLGALLVMAAYRGRRLLVRALDEAEQRGALTRFLPAEIASLITDGAFGGGLLPGRRQLAAILFVDIRDSTARAENLDPVDLATFIASFRRCVTRAASEHGGVIDKFIGDGALVVFGLPEPRPDDATRALACARMLLSLIDRWNLERQLEPPVRVGIGVHVGDVFFGVVGDESRKELTVLGDTVNVGARLEQATKTSGTPLLASAEVVEAAGEKSGWTEIRREPLSGRTGLVRVMRPV